MAKFIAPKGSVALNGTSLTVNEVEGTRFGVNIIPHTKEVTTWGAVKPWRRGQSGDRHPGAIRRAACGNERMKLPGRAKDPVLMLIGLF